MHEDKEQGMDVQKLENEHITEVVQDIEHQGVAEQEFEQEEETVTKEVYTKSDVEQQISVILEDAGQTE